MSNGSRTPRLTLEDGLVEVQRNGAPLWLWADTCPEPDCGCRSAVIVASRCGSRDAVLQTAATVRKGKEVGQSPKDVEDEIGEDCAVFDLDIDTGETRRVDDDQWAPLPDEYPWLNELLDAIDGDVLERLGRLWYQGKGKEAPDTAPQPPERIEDWEPGRYVSWIEAYFGVRMDFYVVDGRRYEAADLYCVDPDCACGRVQVLFNELDLEYSKFVGVAKIEHGTTELEVVDGTKELLDRLWAAFQKRYPRFLDRHAQRYPRMKEFGRLLHARYAAKTSPKVGPNEKCPCGSGKKYKKCCWLKTLVTSG